MAEDQDQTQKTEDPTPKKLQDARDKGQVASSREVNNFFVLAAGLMAFGLLAPDAGNGIKASLARFITEAGTLPTGDGAIGIHLVEALLQCGKYLILPSLGFITAAFASGAIQNNILWTAESLKPKAERISPLAGFKRLFSLKSIVEFIKSLLKMVIVATACIILVYPKLDLIVASRDMDTHGWLAVFLDLTLSIAITAVVIVAVFAALDYGYQHFEFMKQMRMSLQDIKDEHKQTDGDPKIKQRLRQLRMEKAQRRMMAEVPTSTVVITNPTHFSIALRYDRGSMPAPQVVAKGVDELAMRIREVARANEVPIIENPPLARALYAQSEPGETIPFEHYQTVAEIIGYVMQLASKPKVI